MASPQTGDEMGKIEPEKSVVTGNQFLEALEKMCNVLKFVGENADRLADSMTAAQGVLEKFSEVAKAFVEAHPEIVEEDEPIPYPECAQLPLCPYPDECHHYEPEIPGCGRLAEETDDEIRAKNEMDAEDDALQGGVVEHLDREDDAVPPPPAGGKGD